MRYQEYQAATIAAQMESQNVSEVKDSAPAEKPEEEEAPQPTPRASVRVEPNLDTVAEDDDPISEQVTEKEPESPASKQKRLKQRLRTVSGKSVRLYEDKNGTGKVYETREEVEDQDEDQDDAALSTRKKSKKKVTISKQKSKKSSKKAKIGVFSRHKFDHRAVMEDIRYRKQVSYRVPGSPILTIVPLHTESITDSVLCPHDEVVRRRSLNETRIYIKLFYNENMIMQTSVKEIDEETFSINWHSIDSDNDAGRDASETTEPGYISVIVSQEPESIKAEIYEVVFLTFIQILQAVFGDALAGECFIAVPSPTETTAIRDRHVSDLTFTGRSFRPGKLETQPKSEVSEYGDREHWVTGSLKLNVLWAVDHETGSTLGPRKNKSLQQNGGLATFNVDPLRQVGPAGSLSIRKLMVSAQYWLMRYPRTGSPKYV